jgi:hypothetical protein
VTLTVSLILDPDFISSITGADEATQASRRVDGLAVKFRDDVAALETGRSSRPVSNDS